VHDNINFAKTIDGGSDRGFDLLWFANVRRDGKGFAMERGHPCLQSVRSALIVDRLCRRLQMFHAAAYQRYVRARLRERARDTASDTGAAAGNEGDPILENSICENCGH